MALNLPLKFASDIAGRDTALVPVVIIGNYDHDTGEFTSDHYDLSTGIVDITYYPNILPILLNIPSLKESIDIEKRNYKISSINIDISNFPYNGKRFSELVADKSLINTEVRVYWKSPSTTHILFADGGTDPDSIPDYALFQVYFGTVRRYEMTDEKVRLVVEDRSQATLHRDLPLSKHYLTGDTVPDKYKNKPKPMVYGHVDRSPGVVSTDTIINESDDGISSGTFKVLFDSSTIKFKDTEDSDSRLLMSPLYIYLGDAYLPISYWKDNAKNFLPAGEYDFNSSNLFINNSEGDITFNTGGVDTDSRFNNLRINLPRVLGNEAFVVFWLGGMGSYGMESWETAPYLTEPVNLGNIKDGSLSSFVEINGQTFADHGYYDVDEQYIDMNSSVPVYIKIILDPISDIPDIVEHEGYAFIKTDSGSEQSSHIVPAIWTKEILNGDISGGSAGYFHRNIETQLSVTSSGYNTIGGSVVFFNPSFDNTSSLVYDSILLKNFSPNDNTINIGIPPHGVSSEAGGLADQALELRQKIYELNLVNSIVVEGIPDKDFYANVMGRGMRGAYGVTDPAAPGVITDILNTELGQDVEVTGDYDWQYAFTVDKKINSKKLIEGIASASTYIPRFNAMGVFKFTEIKEIYTDADLVNAGGNEIIKEADVIDYSYKRTKIEDVKTKIEFFYNWDYARGEFNSSVISDIEHTLMDYGYDYYGLAQPELVEGGYIHPESTLIIDDDRGKYIRDHDTAQYFADWMLMWSINQHLIMKLKLPLKYMNLEIGDIIEFDAVLGKVKPYGIDYTTTPADPPNGQNFLPYFMVTSTSKTLEYVQIECIQMHELTLDQKKYGCIDELACNYDADANTNNGTCFYAGQSNSEITDAPNLLYKNCDEECSGLGDSDGDGICDEEDDCITGSGIYDECGVCGGNGYADWECNDGSSTCWNIPNGACDCEGNVLDCCQVCGGTDICVVCTNPNTLNYNEILPQNDLCNFHCMYPKEVFGDNTLCFGETLNDIPVDNFICSDQEYDARCVDGVLSDNSGVWDVTGLNSTVPPGQPGAYPWAEMWEYCNNCDGCCANEAHEKYPLLLAESGCNAHYPEGFNLGSLTLQAFNDSNYTNLVYEKDMTNGLIDDLTYTEYHALKDAVEQYGVRLKLNLNMESINHAPMDVNVQLHINIPSWDEDVYCYGENLGCINVLEDYALATGENIINIDLPKTYQWFDYFETSLLYNVQIKVSSGGNEHINYNNTIALSSNALDPDYCPQLGDMNDDGIWDSVDAELLIKCVLQQDCLWECAGDMNGSGSMTMTDIVLLYNCIASENCGG